MWWERGWPKDATWAIPVLSGAAQQTVGFGDVGCGQDKQPD